MLMLKGLFFISILKKIVSDISTFFIINMSIWSYFQYQLFFMQETSERIHSKSLFKCFQNLYSNIPKNDIIKYVFISNLDIFYPLYPKYFLWNLFFCSWPLKIVVCLNRLFSFLQAMITITDTVVICNGSDRGCLHTCNTWHTILLRNSVILRVLLQ